MTTDQSPQATPSEAAPTKAEPTKKVSDHVKDLQDKTATSWAKTYQIAGYEMNPQVLTKKLLPVIKDPTAFWTSGFSQITNGELILGLGAVIAATTLVQIIFSMSLLPLTLTLMTTTMGLLGGAIFLMILGAIFKTPQKSFEELLRASAVSALLMTPMNALTSLLPYSLYMLAMLAFAVASGYIGWHIMTKYLKMTQRQAIITYVVTGIAGSIVPMMAFVVAMFAVKSL